jgi:hypothetical protein
MRDLVVLFIHFIATLARLLRPGGARSIVAESLLLKHQLLILNRSRQRAPNLSVSDRILAGWLALWLRFTRLLRSAIVLKPSTLLGLHQDVQAKIPHAGSHPITIASRPEGTECRTRRCGRRYEATQSPLGLSANR